MQASFGNSGDGAGRSFFSGVTKSVDRDSRNFRPFRNNSNFDRDGDLAGRAFSRAFSRVANSSLGRESQSISRAFSLLYTKGGILASGLSLLVGTVSTAVGALGLLVGAAGSAASSVAALGPALGAAIQGGVGLAIAFQGVGAAISSGMKAATAAVTATGKGTQRAAASTIGAQRAVADARARIGDVLRANAERLAEANKRVAESEGDVARAQRDVTQAQRDLTAARKDAQEELQQLAFSAEDAALAEERAGLNLEKAYQDMLVTQDRPVDDRGRREAELAYKEAELNYRQAKDRSADLGEEQAKAAETGIKGTKAYQSAQKGVLSAQEQLNNAESQLADARAARSKAAADGQRDLAKAQQQLSRAQQDLARQQRDAAASAAGGADAAAKAANAYEQALSRLSPSAAAFVRYIVGMRDRFNDFKKAVQEPFFAAFLGPFKDFVDRLLPVAQKSLAATTGILGQMSAQFMNAVGAAEFGRMLDQNNRFLSVFVDESGDGVSTIEGLANIFFKLYQALEPLANRFANFIKNFIDAKSAALDTQEGFESVVSFFERAGDRMSAFFQIFSAIGSALGSVFKAAEGPINTMLQSMINSFQGLATTAANSQGALTAYFSGVVANAQPLFTLLGSIAKVFLTMGASPKLGETFRILQGGVPFLQILADAANDAAPVFARLVVAILRIFAALANTGAFTAFLNVFSTLAEKVADFIELPFVQEILKFVLPILAVVKAFSVLGIGLVLIGKLFLGNIIGAVGFIKTIKDMLKFMGAFNPVVGGVVLALGLLIPLFIKLFKENQSFRDSIMNLLGTFMSLGQTVISQLVPIFMQFAGLVTSAIGQIIPIFTKLLSTLLPMIAQLAIAIVNGIIPVITALAPVIVQVIGTVMATLSAAIPLLLTLITAIVPVVTVIIKSVIGIFLQIIPIVLPILLQLIKIIVGVLIPAFQMILPVVLAVVKILIGAFVQILSAVLPVVMEIFNLVSTVLIPIIASLLPVVMTVISTVAGVILELLPVVLPVFQQIVEIIVSTVIPIFQSMMGIVVQVIKIIIGIFQIILPILLPIIGVLAKLIGVILVVAFKALVMSVKVAMGIILAVVKFVFGGISLLWNNVLKPVFTAIVSIIGFVVEQVRKKLTDFQNVFKTGMSVIQFAYNTYVKPYVDKIISYISNLKSKGEQAAQGFSNAFKGLRDGLKVPIREALNFINTHLIGNLNKVTSKFGLTLPTIPVRFAEGGRVRGAGTDTSDSIDAKLSNDEQVIKARSARRLGYDNLAYMNKYGKIPPSMVRIVSVNKGHRGTGGILDDLQKGWEAVKSVGGAIGGALAQGAEHALSFIWDKAIIPVLGTIKNNGIVGQLIYGVFKALRGHAEDFGKTEDKKIAEQRRKAALDNEGSGAGPSGNFGRGNGKVSGPVLPFVRAAGQILGRAFGFSSVFTYPGHQPTQSRALDFMIKSKAQGDAMSSYVTKHAKALNILYMIWNRRMWRDYSPRGWRPYFDGGSSNPNRAHTNHVHLSFDPSGSMPKLSPKRSNSGASDGGGEGSSKYNGKKGGWVYPLSRRVGITQYPNRGHSPSWAVDFGAPNGTGVRSVSDGVVEIVRHLLGSYGRYIKIRHPSGIKSLYAHLSKMGVHVGQRVGTGQSIGKSGYSGNVRPRGPAGAHLHFELGTSNSVAALRSRGVRLAQGGVVRATAGGVFAQLAEAGKHERVEPLDSQGMSARDRAIIAEIIRNAGGLGGGSGPTLVKVFIGETELTDMVRLEIQEENSNIASAVTSGRQRSR